MGIVRVISVVFVLVGLITTVSSGALSKPMRILSLDYCADQFVLALADRDQIIGLSIEATDPHSYYRERAIGIRQVRVSSDLILSLKPDLVVRSWAGDGRLLSLLERLDVPVLNINYVADIGGKNVSNSIMDISVGKINRAAKAFEQQPRGNDIIADLESRFQSLKTLPPIDKQAIYLTPGAFSTGAETSMNAIITLAGLDNYLANLGYKGWAPIPLEHLASQKPDLFITGFYDVKSATQNHWGVTNHKFARDILEETKHIDVKGSLVACDGLFMVEAAEVIRAKAEEDNP